MSPARLSKGARDAIEWYRERDTGIPRIVWGKHLKLKHEVHEAASRLDEPLSEDERNEWSGLDVDRSGEFG